MEIEASDRTLAEGKKEAAPAGVKRNEKLLKLTKERLDAATEEWDERFKLFRAGQGTLDCLLGASRRLLQAQAELGVNNADKVAGLAAQAKRMKGLDEMIQRLFATGQARKCDAAQAKYCYLEAQIMLERAKNAGK